MRALKLAVVVPGLMAGLLMASAGPAWAPCHIITFEGDPYAVGEGSGKITVTVSNNGGAQTSDMMVDYETVNGSAKSGSDYTAKSGTVTFPAGGGGERSFEVPISNDSADEPVEQFTIRLSNVRPASSCVSTPNIQEMTATVSIADDDPAPQPRRTQQASPKPKTTPKASTPASTPTATRTPSPSPGQTPTETATPTPTPSETETAVAVAEPDDSDSGGLSGGAVAGIVAAVIVLGGGGALLVRRRFLG